MRRRRMEELIRIATIYACAGDPRRDYFLAAIGERADGTIVLSRNESTPVKTPQAHAEARLVKKLGKNATFVIVVRVSKGDGSLAMAKPCVHCAKALENFKVKKVYFTTSDGIELL